MGDGSLVSKAKGKAISGFTSGKGSGRQPAAASGRFLRLPAHLGLQPNT